MVTNIRSPHENVLLLFLCYKLNILISLTIGPIKQIKKNINIKILNLKKLKKLKKITLL